MFLYMTMEGLAKRSRSDQSLDEGLLPRVGNGDRAALEALYVQTEKAVYALALSILRDPEDARDVTQEVSEGPGRRPPVCAPGQALGMALHHHPQPVPGPAAQSLL